MYKCTYCRNLKTDQKRSFDETNEYKYKCTYCRNFSFERTILEWENMMNNNVM